MEAYTMSKDLKDIISEENYGTSSNLEREKYNGTQLPRPSNYTEDLKFQADLQDGITEFLNDIGYDPLTDDVQYQDTLSPTDELDILHGKTYHIESGSKSTNY